MLFIIIAAVAALLVSIWALRKRIALVFVYAAGYMLAVAYFFGGRGYNFAVRPLEEQPKQAAYRRSKAALAHRQREETLLTIIEALLQLRSGAYVDSNGKVCMPSKDGLLTFKKQGHKAQFCAQSWGRDVGLSHDDVAKYLVNVVATHNTTTNGNQP